MNWYKEAQQNNWIITKLVSSFGTAAVLVLVGMYGLQGLSSQYQSNPQQIEQQAKQIAENPEQQTQIPQEATVEPIPDFQNITEEQPEQQIAEPQVAEPQKSVNINIDKIWEIESSRGTNPNMDLNNKKARGHYQFLKPTWDECVSRMGKNWDWWNGAMDYGKSTQVANYYFNKRIPDMLNYYDITDSVDTRIAAYDWGIGKLLKVWKELGENWKSVAPSETKEYIEKYNN